MLGAPSLPCWPRGLPLQNIKEEVVPSGVYVDSKKFQFAVLQSLADVQPDVDAIYRLTKNTPFQFKRPEPFDAPSVKEGNWVCLIFLKVHVKCRKCFVLFILFFYG